MIHSILLLNSTGEIIIEKHYRGTTARTDPFRHPNPPPILPTQKGANIHLKRNGLTLLATVQTDTNPLFVTQFLSTLADLLTDYFGELNEHAIKDNFITVYELLDEMLDNGIPATLEPNALKELIAPPSMLNRVFETLGAEQPKRPLNAPATIPWRRANVRHAQNEVFVDITETIDAVYSAHSRALSHLLITGVVSVNSRLSGVPDISMRVRANAPLDDVALHHCVRLARFVDSETLSFVPPDGQFDLMKYAIRDARGVTLPVELSSRIDFDHKAATGNVSITLSPRFPLPAAPAPTAAAAGGMMLAQVMSAAGGKPVSVSGDPDTIMDSVAVRVPFGDGVTGASLSANYGTVQYADGMCTWNVGSVLRGKTPSLVGNVSLAKGSETKLSRPPILLSFRIPGFVASGVNVESLELGSGERYKYYKGLKCITKAGLYEIRA